LARRLHASLLLAALLAFCLPASAQLAAKLLAYWNFNDASNPAQSVATVGGFVGVFTNNPAGDPTNNPVYTADGGGFSALPGDRALDFGLNQSYRLMRCTDIAAALNAAAVNDKISVTFRQKWNTTAAISSSFYFTSPSSSGNWRGFQAHCPYNTTPTFYFDTAGCCTAGANRLSGTISVNYQQWRLFAFVKNGLDKQVIVDGAVGLSGTGANPLPTDFTEVMVGGAYVVGAPTAAVGNNIRGVIDDFAIWEGALTPAQLAALNSGLTPDQVAMDSDGDGMPDWYEDFYSFDKNNPADAAQDTDSDGLTNLQEYNKGTNPRIADSDGDGLLDGVETGTGFYSSATDTGTNPLDPDTDDDLLLDGVENNTGVFQDVNHTGTSPHSRDWDGDGFGDGAEVALGSSPVDFASRPNKGTGSRILGYWNFDTNTAPAQALDAVHGLLAVFTNGLVTLTNGTVVVTNGATYTADGGGHTAKPGDRAVDLGTNSAQRVILSRAIAPYLQVASAADPTTGLDGEQMSVSFWQKWSVVPVGSSSFWMVSPSAVGNRGFQAHNPNGGAAGIIYFDTAGCCTVPQQRLQGTAPAGFDWQKWHHFAFIKNGVDKQVWIDGVAVLSTNGASTLPADFTDLIIGASYPNYAAQFRGLMDDFAVYGTALTTNQIQALAYGVSPLNVDTGSGDTDGDGMPDAYEDFYGLNKNNPADANSDLDNDGSPNLQEYQRQTLPNVADTDGDGLKDGVESNTGYWTSATDTGTDPLKADWDGDGLLDGVETHTGVYVNASNTGTDPFLTDSDFDAYGDGAEMLLGSNPSDINSTPVTPGATNLLAYWSYNDATVADQALDQIHGFVARFEGVSAYTGNGGGRSGQAGDRAVDLGTNGTSVVRNTAGQWLSAVGPNDAITVSFWERWTTPVANSFGFHGTSPSSAQSRGASAHSPYGDGQVYWDTGGVTAGTMRINLNAAGIAAVIPGYTNYNDYYLNTWRHFAFVKNGTTKQIWMDGVLVLEGVNTLALKTDFTEFLMGNDLTGLTGFRGQLDDMAVYASALSSNNIVALSLGASPIDFSGATEKPPLLSLERLGSDVVLSWSGTGFNVQTNLDVTTPAGWGNVPGATTSPYTNPLPAVGNSYFRLKK